MLDTPKLDTTRLNTTRLDTTDLGVVGDAELVEELSLLTTQTARMRARMADIMAELEHRRGDGCGGRHAAAGRPVR